MNVQDHAIRNLVSIEDLADLLGVSVRHVRRLVSESRIPFHKRVASSASTSPKSTAG
jgi:hypothetical protein